MWFIIIVTPSIKQSYWVAWSCNASSKEVVEKEWFLAGASPPGGRSWSSCKVFLPRRKCWCLWACRLALSPFWGFAVLTEAWDLGSRLPLYRVAPLCPLSPQEPLALPPVALTYPTFAAAEEPVFRHVQLSPVEVASAPEGQCSALQWGQPSAPGHDCCLNLGHSPPVTFPPCSCPLTGSWPVTQRDSKVLSPLLMS